MNHGAAPWVVFHIVYLVFHFPITVRVRSEGCPTEDMIVCGTTYHSPLI